MEKPTMQNIADAAGVSIATASLALAGKGRVSTEIRQRVLDTATSLGYQKNRRSTSRQRGRPIIGILFFIDPDRAYTFRFNTPLIGHIESHFALRKCQVVIIPITEQMSPEEICLRVENLECKGLFSIYYGSEPAFVRLKSRGIAVVLIMNSQFQDQITTVTVDDFEGAYEGALHLIKGGHRKLLFIDIERGSLPLLSIERFTGFKKAVEEHNIPLSDVERLTYDRSDHDYLRDRLSVIFSSPERPSAIFALDDEIAARARAILVESGVQVPRDVSILAPGDLLDYGQEHSPSISTMQIDTDMMGSIACNLMENQLKQTNSGLTVLKIKQRLVLRGSTRQYDSGLKQLYSRKTSELLPREKVLAAFNHIDIGTVPIWIGCSPEFWEKAKQATGYNDDDLNRRFGNDFRQVQSLIGGADSRWRSPFGHERRPPGYGQPVRRPLLEKPTLAALRNFPWPEPAQAEIRHLVAEARPQHQEFAIMGGEWSPFWHDAIDFVGTQDLYYLMYDEPEFVIRLIDRIVDYYVAVTTQIFETAGQYIDIFFIGNDFGGQTAPLLSLDQFEHFITPALKRLTNLGHRYGKKVMLHSAGAIRPLLPAIIRSGIDAIHGIQPDCAGMGPVGIKKEFGPRVCLSGSIDAMNILLSGSPETVRQATLETLEIMAPGGAYVASPSHEALLVDTPPANVLAFVDAVREFNVQQNRQSQA